jgi:hypothetical protein
VLFAIIDEDHLFSLESFVVFDLNVNGVETPSIQVSNSEALPRRRNTWLERQLVVTHLQPQDVFDTCPVDPTGRTGVPAPTTTPNMRTLGIHIARHYIRFELVALRIGSVFSVVNGIEKREQLEGLLPISQERRRDNNPGGRMRVLSAIFPDPGQVTFDVAWIMKRFVEWRFEQENHFMARLYEMLEDRAHGLPCPFGFCSTRYHSP